MPSMYGVSSAQMSFERAFESWVTELFFKRRVGALEAEIVATAESLNRVTAGPVQAQASFPSFYSAAVGGLAVESARTQGASESSPLHLSVEHDCAFVDSCAPLTAPYDAVIPFTELQLRDKHTVIVSRPSDPWRNVRPAGEDIQDRELILPSGHLIGPLDIGAMLAGGVTNVEVRRRPRVAVVAVGRGIVPATATPAEGQMVDAISPALLGLVQQYGGCPCPVGVLGDDCEELKHNIRALASGHDAIVVVASPKEDLATLASVLDETGEVITESVALQPGSATILACVEDCPLVVVSCYQLAAYVSFSLFVRPIIQVMLGEQRGQDTVEWANLLSDMPSAVGVEEYQRVRLGVVDGQRVAVPLPRSNTQIMSLVRADGLVRIPAEVKCLEAGAQVPIKRIQPVRAIDRTIVAAGTHDICFDLLSRHCLEQHQDLRFVWTGGGGRQGVERMRSHLCHLASMHIFDTERGIYNIPYLEKHCPGQKFVLVNLFRRPLGLAVKAGNPKGIRSLADITRSDVRFVNRQPGSGTRKLLEYWLSHEGLSLAQASDTTCSNASDTQHDLVAPTHLGAAVMVASGRGDAALVVSPAARGLGLDFIPLVQEQLDFAFPEQYLEDRSVQALLEVMASSTFREDAENTLAHYDMSRSGQVIWHSQDVVST